MGRFHQPVLGTVFRYLVLFRSSQLCVLAVRDYILVSVKPQLLLSNRPQVATFHLTGRKHSDLSAGLIPGWRVAGQGGGARTRSPSGTQGTTGVEKLHLLDLETNWKIRSNRRGCRDTGAIRVGEGVEDGIKRHYTHPKNVR